MEKSAMATMVSSIRGPAGMLHVDDGYDPLPALRRFRGPAMAVTIKDGNPGDLHQLIPGLSHRTIECTSHWPQLDKPDDFNRVVDDFLAQVR